MKQLQFQNRSAYRYVGWLSCTAVLSDAEVGAGFGTCRGLPFVVGKPNGLVGHHIDVMADLNTGDNFTAPLEFTGEGPVLSGPRLGQMGQPTIAGVPMWFVNDLEVGPVWHTHLRARVGPMLVEDLRMRLSSDPWATFTARTTASNPAVTDVSAIVPEGFDLRCGNAIVSLVTVSETNPGFLQVLPGGLQMGDGQSLTVAGCFVWPELFTRPTDADSARAACSGEVGAWDPDWETNIGPLRALAKTPDGYDGAAWARQNSKGARLRLLTWQEGPLSITANSGQTGAEEEQPGLAKVEAIFKGGGWEAIQTLRYVAYGFGRVPCHHRERDGSPLNPDAHPDCMLWDGRPHKAMPDLLGKPPDSFGNWLSHDWWGPNDEHFFIGTLASVCQVTGDREAQALLAELAVVWLMSDTVDPRMSTSGPRAARARGWASIAASWFWVALADRKLAQRVKDRYVERLRMYRDFGAREGLIWDPRPNDSDGDTLIGLARDVWSGGGRSPFPKFVMPYQVMVACGGIQVAGETLGLPEACSLAHAQAARILDNAWKQLPDGSWQGWEVLGVNEHGETLSPEQFIEGQGAHHSGLFDGGEWWALGVWCVLRNDPNNAKARAIWQQFVRAKNGGNPWLLPMPTQPVMP